MKFLYLSLSLFPGMSVPHFLTGVISFIFIMKSMYIFLRLCCCSWKTAIDDSVSKKKYWEYSLKVLYRFQLKETHARFHKSIEYIFQVRQSVDDNKRRVGCIFMEIFKPFVNLLQVDYVWRKFRITLMVW